MFFTIGRSRRARVRPFPPLKLATLTLRRRCGRSLATNVPHAVGEHSQHEPAGVWRVDPVQADHAFGVARGYARLHLDVGVAALVVVPDLADPKKLGRADEGEGLVARRIDVGVDVGQVKPVSLRPVEVHNVVPSPAKGAALGRIVPRKRVGADAAGQRIAAHSAPKPVVAAPPVQRIDAVHPEERIITISAKYGIVAAEAQEIIVAVITNETVVTIVTDQDVGEVRSPDELDAGERVALGSAEIGDIVVERYGHADRRIEIRRAVVARAAEQLVGAGAPHEQIVTVSAIEPVVAVTAMEAVVAAVSLDLVVSVEAENCFVVGRPPKPIVAFRAFPILRHGAGSSLPERISAPGQRLLTQASAVADETPPSVGRFTVARIFFGHFE